jgi:UDP-sugar transporter A1/2/3
VQLRDLQVCVCVIHVSNLKIAGVYFEAMLKDGSSTPFWIRNLQMYSCGIISAGLSCVLTERSDLMDKGFFFGYDTSVFIIVGLFICV